jgi:hypothetical protein
MNRLILIFISGGYKLVLTWRPAVDDVIPRLPEREFCS